MNIREHLHDTFVPHARNNYQPFALARRPLSLYAVFLVGMKVLTLVSLAVLPQNQAFSSSLSTENILNLTNSSRSSFGLQTVQENGFLTKAAQSKASEMAKLQYFSHISPQGKTPWNFIKEAGYNYAIAGENLAINFYSAEGVEAAWMNSPGHKANILNKDFEEIGIGVANGIYKGSKAVFVVQMFGARVDRPLIPKTEFSVLAKKTTESLFLPEAKMIILAKPILTNSIFSLTNKKSVQIQGLAPGAEEVYILVNNRPEYKFKVIANEFLGSIKLSEGTNSIKAVGYYGGIISSPPSESVVVKVDLSSPQIADIEMTPHIDQGVYAIKVRADRDVAKLLVSLADRTIMLVPDASGTFWQGNFDFGSQNPHGKLIARAYDLAGNEKILTGADFSKNAVEVYGFHSARQAFVSFMGKDLEYPKVNQLNGFFAAGLIGLLGVNVGIRKNIQSLPHIAETVGFILFILLLWMI